jgi:outer membrane murein-binding lipoprotein Lpp
MAENRNIRDRMNKKIIAIALLIAILFVSAIAGTIFYYNGKIANLNSQIANLNSQISNLNDQIKNLEAPYLVTSLGIHEVNNGTFDVDVGTGEKVVSNALSILGNVTNEGKSTAYHVGLYVVAQNFWGVTVINMTVPLAGISGTASIPNGDNLPLTESIEPYQSVQLYINILCQNAVPTNWTITPVCTNSP